VILNPVGNVNAITKRGNIILPAIVKVYFIVAVRKTMCNRVNIDPISTTISSYDGVLECLLFILRHYIIVVCVYIYIVQTTREENERIANTDILLVIFQTTLFYSPFLVLFRNRNCR